MKRLFARLLLRTEWCALLDERARLLEWEQDLNRYAVLLDDRAAVEPIGVQVRTAARKERETHAEAFLAAAIGPVDGRHLTS